MGCRHCLDDDRNRRGKSKVSSLISIYRDRIYHEGAELAVNHPQRRRIVTWLMILGNTGIVTIVVTATSSLITSEGYRLPITVIVVVAGIYLVYKLLSRGALARKWEHFIENRFAKSRILEEATMEDLLHLIEG